jgi:hypothetical protein
MDAGSLIGLALGFGIVVGVALIARVARREQLPTTPRPSMPAARAPAPAPIAPAKHQVVSLRKGVDFGVQLREHTQAAELGGLRPFLEFTASWCPPSAAFDESLEHPLMVEALRGTYLIRVDIDEFSGFDGYQEYGFKVFGVPLFFELDAESRPTGRQITSNAWGPDIPENMGRVMGAFFRG